MIRINQLDRMALVAGLGARMSLVAMVTRFHGGTAGPRGQRVVFDIAVAIGAQGVFLRMEFVGNENDAYALQVRLLAAGEGRMTPQAVLIHQRMTGRKFPGNEFPRTGMTIRTGDGSRMDPGGKP